MGALIRRTTGDRYNLQSRHVLGRSPNCQLRLENDHASTAHAELLWQISSWEIHDLGSRNGTYVNGRRLEPGGRVTLQRNAQLAFANIYDPFDLVDDGPPRAVAVSDDGQRQESEAGYLLLPDPECPICTIFDAGGGTWVVESDDGARQEIASGETLQVAERTWRIELPGMPETTSNPDIQQLLLRDATMQFSVDDTRERLEIRLIHGDKVILLPARAYHHVLLTLAQTRLDDQATAGVAGPDIGWMPTAALLDLVNMSQAACNVYISRARKDITRAGLAGAMDLIERQPAQRRLRLGVRKVEIIHT